jgi:hypothetical protein
MTEGARMNGDDVRSILWVEDYVSRIGMGMASRLLVKF